MSIALHYLLLGLLISIKVLVVSATATAAAPQQQQQSSGNGNSNRHNKTSSKPHSNRTEGVLHTNDQYTLTHSVATRESRPQSPGRSNPLNPKL